ncbi:uncharacterized protein [Amphiura filiformis]|uniref:uncharacterized protein n=1 Tax=Amphiura filiformis TaxID=82378 RepID=UPI003B228BFC
MKINFGWTLLGCIFLAIEFAPVLCTHCTTTDTPNAKSYQYVWPEIPVGATSFTFSVTASSDVHVALSDEYNQLKYEIVIGAGVNTYSAIRLCGGCTNEVREETPGELSSTECRDYNISFENGDLVTVSRVGQASPFMSFQNTNRFDVRTIGISTGFGSQGIWTFCGLNPGDAENPNGNWGFEPADDVCCPSLWSSFMGSCYRYYQYQKTWANANTYCQARGAELVSIHSAAENGFVSYMINGGNVWIGLTDTATEGTFVWSDGTAVDYTNWGTDPISQPDNYAGDEDCVELGSTYFSDPTLNLWNDHQCSNTKSFVCKK